MFFWGKWREHGCIFRTIYVICKVRCRMTRRGSLLKKYEEFQDANSSVLHRARGLLRVRPCATASVTHAGGPPRIFSLSPLSLQSGDFQDPSPPSRLPRPSDWDWLTSPSKQLNHRRFSQAVRLPSSVLLLHYIFNF